MAVDGRPGGERSTHRPGSWSTREKGVAKLLTGWARLENSPTQEHATALLEVASSSGASFIPRLRRPSLSAATHVMTWVAADNLGRSGSSHRLDAKRVARTAS